VSESSPYLQNPVAVWQCRHCGFVRTYTLHGGVTQYAPPKWHTCKSYFFSAFVPLNDIAKSLTESHEAFLQEQQAIRDREKEALKDWPPAPGFRCYWES
jgi:transposase-like protein